LVEKLLVLKRNIQKDKIHNQKRNLTLLYNCFVATTIKGYFSEEKIKEKAGIKFFTGITNK
jgi:hypothetical protein